MLDTDKVSKAVCDIETQICYLHGLLAAEELGVAALQSGEAPSQQLKPKMPLLTEILSAYAAKNPGYMSTNIEGAMCFAYKYISRHFGH